MRLDDPKTDWKELYIAGILEIDSEKILSRIHNAKMAICDRVEELNGGGNPGERIALSRAMRALTELQKVYRGVVQEPRHAFTPRTSVEEPPVSRMLPDLKGASTPCPL